MKHFLIFDTETNGLPKDWNGKVQDVDNWPRIIQLAFNLVTEDGQVVKSEEYLIKPDGWEIPKEKFWIDNGYSTEKSLEVGVPIEDALYRLFLSMIEADFLVAHNIDFDVPVVGAEMIRKNIKVGKKLDRICTMKGSTQFCKLPAKFGSDFKFPRLEELHQILFNEGFENAHDALADVNACQRCLFELIRREIIPNPLISNQ